MAIKRFYAEKDNTITNAYKPNLTTRATSSNMGAADILEVFSIYGQASQDSAELARILIQFPMLDVKNAVDAGEIPADAKYYLRLFNAVHQETLPDNYNLTVCKLTQAWTEGSGLDMNDYGDVGVSNWVSASTGNAWDNDGNPLVATPGAFGNTSTTIESDTFIEGTENLEVDVTSIVSSWLLNTALNYGFLVKLATAYESATRSYYVKKFFGRGSEFFFKRPVIEARWNDSKKDNRGNFVISSSMLTANDNLNKLYLYNVYKGQYKDVQGLTGDKLFVSLYRGSLTDASPTSFTASKVETGIYTASVYLNTTASTIYDVWSTGSSQGVNDGARATQFYTGSITPISHAALDKNPSDSYIVNITNLKKSYEASEKARFRVYARNLNWSPTVYTVASTNIQASQIENLYYRISREVDDLVIIDFGTGSVKYSLTSYDKNGNYFDLDMNLLEANYSYVISFLVEENGNRKQIKNTFRFRVEESNE